MSCRCHQGRIQEDFKLGGVGVGGWWWGWGGGGWWVGWWWWWVGVGGGRGNIFQIHFFLLQYCIMSLAPYTISYFLKMIWGVSKSALGHVDLTGVALHRRPQASLFEPKFLNQWCIFGEKNPSQGYFSSEVLNQWQFFFFFFFLTLGSWSRNGL